MFTRKTTHHHGRRDSPCSKRSKPLEVQIDGLSVNSLEETMCRDDVELFTGSEVDLLCWVVMEIPTSFVII